MIPFWKINPGGNPTILLRAEDVPPEERASAARIVMDSQHLHAEQVGYIRLEGTPRLDMMGGEFCLNATRSFAVVLALHERLRRKGDLLSGEVEVSGTSDTILVQVRKTSASFFYSEACMHFPSLPVPEHPIPGMTLIRIPGIPHILQQGTPPSSSDLPRLCAEQRKICGVEWEEAVGSLWVQQDEAAGAAGKMKLSPVVWVRDTNSLCWETACGSGTMACAIASHALTGTREFSIVQPSGCALSVRLERTPSGWDVWVGGPVRVTAEGRTDLTPMPPQNALAFARGDV